MKTDTRHIVTAAIAFAMGGAGFWAGTHQNQKMPPRAISTERFDPEAQKVYEEQLRQGVLKQNSDATAAAQELISRGVIKEAPLSPVQAATEEIGRAHV